MATSDSVDELLASLKDLYESAEYSDLTVTCGDSQLQVHRAVVYPRAPRLKDLAGYSDEAPYNRLDLSEDDPQAVQLLLYYLYQLDYPYVPPPEGQESSNGTSGLSRGVVTPPAGTYIHHADIQKKQQEQENGGGNHVVGAAAAAAEDTVSVKCGNGGGVKLHIPEYSIEKETFIHRDLPSTISAAAAPSAAVAGDGDDIVPSKKDMIKKKKKKLRSMIASSTSPGAVAAPVADGTDTAVNVPDATGAAVNGNNKSTDHESSENVHTTQGMQSHMSIKGAGNHQKQQCDVDQTNGTQGNNADDNDSNKKKTAASTQAQQKQHPNLTLHAKIFALATKYAVSSLRTLSTQKFQHELLEHWDHDDFLSAAREAYTSTDRVDRVLRDAVLQTIKVHQDELLGREQVQEVIRGLELSFDLLMHLHGNNGSTSTTSSTVNGSTAGGGGLNSRPSVLA